MGTSVEVIVLTISAVFSGILPPAFGFGCAVLHNCLWYFWDDLDMLEISCSQLQLVASVSLLNIVTYGGAVVHWYDHIHWRNGFLLTLCQVPGSILGVYMVYLYGEDVWFTRSMGIIYLLALISLMLKEYYATDKHETADFNEIWSTPRMAAVTIFTCLASGTMAGLTGAGAPPFVIYTLFYNFERSSFIGTYKVSRTLITVAVLTQITISPSHEGWIREMLWVYVGTVMGGWVGVLIGYWIADKVDQQVFSNVLHGLLLVSGVLAVTKDSPTRLWVMAAAGVLAAFYYGAPNGVCCWSRNWRLEHQILTDTAARASIQNLGGTFPEKPQSNVSRKSKNSRSGFTESDPSTYESGTASFYFPG